jgi:hypothetical protein
MGGAVLLLLGPVPVASTKGHRITTRWTELSHAFLRIVAATDVVDDRRRSMKLVCRNKDEVVIWPHNQRDVT